MFSTRQNKNGFALLMVVLLLAMLSGVSLHSLMTTQTRLKANDLVWRRFQLRSALLDATWIALRQSLPAGETSARSLASQLPDHTSIELTLTPLDRQKLPRPLQRPDLPVFGQFIAITASAGMEGLHALSRGLACRLPTGEIRLLAWVECN